MKGKLSKTERGWFVKYKMVDDLIATDGGIIPIHPDYEKYYFLDEDAEGGEVEFEIVREYIDEHTNQVQSFAKLKRKSPPELLHRDGTPMRSYSSPKIQELLDEIKLEEISKEQIEKERNPAYKYFDIDKKEQKKMLVELMEEDGKDGLYKTQKCPKCGAPEIEAMNPRTKYQCGSSDYDQRPNTFTQSEECVEKSNSKKK